MPLIVKNTLLVCIAIVMSAALLYAVNNPRGSSKGREVYQLRGGSHYYGTRFGSNEMRVKFLGMIYEDIPCGDSPERCYWTPVQWISVSTPASNSQLP